VTERTFTRDTSHILANPASPTLCASLIPELEAGQHSELEASMQNSENLSATFTKTSVKAVSVVLIMMVLFLVFKPEAKAVPS
jgi:hypothetical protein